MHRFPVRTPDWRPFNNWSTVIEDTMWYYKYRIRMKQTFHPWSTIANESAATKYIILFSQPWVWMFLWGKGFKHQMWYPIEKVHKRLAHRGAPTPTTYQKRERAFELKDLREKELKAQVEKKKFLDAELAKDQQAIKKFQDFQKAGGILSPK